MNWYISVLKNYAEFNGRARRTEYWMFTLFHFIALVVLMIIDGVIGTYPLLTFVYAVGTLVPAIAVSIRRLHDTSRNGWWYLIQLVPFVGPIVFLVFAVSDSTPGQNQWGPNPKGVVAAAPIAAAPIPDAPEAQATAAPAATPAEPAAEASAPEQNQPGQ